MKIVTLKGLASERAKRGITHPGCSPRGLQLRDAFIALGDDPTAEQVNRIVGATQVFLACEECGTHVEVLAEFTGCQSGCYHDDVVQICRACLKKAAKKIRRREDKSSG